MANDNTLWMGDLESYMDERFVFQAFEQMGEAVVRVKLISSKQSRNVAGYCFVEFTDVDAAHKAMLRLNSKVIPGSAPPKRFKLNYASFGREHLVAPEFSLFVGDVSDDIDDYKLYSMFSSCKSAKVVLDNTGKSRGYGFVRFTNEADQQRALLEMQGYSGINGKPLRISLATPKKSSPTASESSPVPYAAVPHCYYQQHFYPSYQPYYGNASDYASAWWLAYQQPSGSNSAYYGQYVETSYCYPEQHIPTVDTSASIVSSLEMNAGMATTTEDDEVVDQDLTVSVVQCNQEFMENSEGCNGFEELLKYVKHGAELCKDVCSILQERSELESSYAKSLSKLASRLSKATTSSAGTLTEAWSLVGTEMEAEAEQHKQFSTSINEDLCKRLKNLSETQSKSRKPIEASVEKCVKTFADRRDIENKCKKIATSTLKEREKAYSALTNLRETGGKSLEKDMPKMEKKLKHLDESLHKADKDYFDSSKKAEICRAELELAVYKAGGLLQILDEERIREMQNCLTKYNNMISAFVPRLEKSCSRLVEAQHSINLLADISKVIETKGCGPRMSEQVLPDFCAEDMHVTMDVNRRKQALQACSNLVSHEVDIERKTLEGVEKLVGVYRDRPSFADVGTRDEVDHRLNSVTAMLRWLDACQFKITVAVTAVEGGLRPQSPLTQFLVQIRDKQGNLQSVLKYPCASDQNAVNRPTRTAISSFYSDSDFDDEPIGTCRAIYLYEAQHYDELTLQPGDVIAVYDKQGDGWWKGELNGKVGVFPSTYVKDA